MATVYSNRGSVHEREIAYTLTDEGIAFEKQLIPYSDITGVHIRFTPSRYYGNNHQCSIYHTGGQLLLNSRKYKSFGNFEFQPKAFSYFIRLLSRHLPDHVYISSGKSPFWYWVEIVAVVFFFLLLDFAFVLFSAWWVLIGFTTVALWRLIPYYRKNYPRKYRSGIPSKLLPH